MNNSNKVLIAFGIASLAVACAIAILIGLA